MVTAPGCPARATISASRWCCLAFSTSCGMPVRLSMRESVSDTSTFTVPTSTGSSMAFSRWISWMMALTVAQKVSAVVTPWRRSSSRNTAATPRA